MKRLLWSLNLMLLPLFAMGQNVMDTISSYESVKDFVKTIHPRFSFMNVDSINSAVDRMVKIPCFCTKQAKNFGLKTNYYLVDLNHDNQKDLLIYGYNNGMSVIAILYINGRYESYNLYLGLWNDCFFPKVSSVQDKNIVNLYYIENYHERQEDPLKLLNNRLIFRNGAFIEYEEKPTSFVIDSIQINIENSWWNHTYSCKIHPNQIQFHKKQGNNDFYETIELLDNEWQNITDLLNYMHFSFLDLPRMDVADGLHYKTTIFYDNSKIKRFNDNHAGNYHFGINSLYKIIEEKVKQADAIIKEKQDNIKPKIRLHHSRVNL